MEVSSISDDDRALLLRALPFFERPFSQCDFLHEKPIVSPDGTWHSFSCPHQNRAIHCAHLFHQNTTGFSSLLQDVRRIFSVFSEFQDIADLRSHSLQLSRIDFNVRCAYISYQQALIFGKSIRGFDALICKKNLDALLEKGRGYRRILEEIRLEYLIFFHRVLGE